MDEETDVDGSPNPRRLPGNLTAAFRRVEVPRPVTAPVGAPPPGEARGSRRTGKRRRVAGGVAVVLVLLLAAVLVWMRLAPRNEARALDVPSSAVTDGTDDIDAPPAPAAGPGTPPTSSAVPSTRATPTSSPTTHPTPKVTGKANPSGANLALHGVATASGIEADGWRPEFAIDGDPSSRWSSAFADPQWIAVDLRQRWRLTEVTLVWETSYGVRYRIDTSLDGKTWTTLWSTDAGHGGTVTVAAKGTVARYVRMYGTRRVSRYGYSLYEFEIR